MKKYFFLVLLFGSQKLWAQHILLVHITDNHTHQGIPGATIALAKVNIGQVSNTNGWATFSNLKEGSYKMQISCLGYQQREIPFQFLKSNSDTLDIGLEPRSEELQRVVISSTRLNQDIKDVPIHVDVIDHDDIAEGTAMSPGNIQEMLSELSGTQLQQTSAVSGNVTIRLQGLDGRYTELLKDGFPLYGGFSGGLSIMQIPPVDLKQVEVIKGSASSLYGGDAIAGIINLISKTPTKIKDEEITLNQTLKGGSDASYYYSKRNLKTGVSLLVVGSHQQPFDVNHDGFTALPKLNQLNVEPTFYWYPNDSTTIRLGLNFSQDERIGGDMVAILKGVDSTHSYLENNKTNRDYYQFSLTHKFQKGNLFTLKNTFGYFYRFLQKNSNVFEGNQYSSFTEASYLVNLKSHQIVTGLDYTTDLFSPKYSTGGINLGYANNTIGLFFQDDWKLGRKMTLETGLRMDHHNRYGDFWLPRAAILYKVNHQFSLRMGGGGGYKIPTIFTSATEENAFKEVYPISGSVSPERSGSMNFDLYYQGHIGEEMTFSLDQNFYFTQLNHPLLPQADSLAKGWLYYYNGSQPVKSSGFETNASLNLNKWSLFSSFTYTNARLLQGTSSEPLPLTPQVKMVSSLTYEVDKNWHASLEAFYTGHQYLDNLVKTPDFWTFDAMVEKYFGNFSILVNLENFTDLRQSKFGPLFTGTIQNPVFNEIYAPLVGRVGNISLRWKL
ncbi:MAG: TonB-dependent receptor [Chitinophagaceae bacterium]